MSIYGNETWYTGEITPNNFAAQPYYKAGNQEPASGLPDSFYGADMGLETPPAAGPLGSPGWPGGTWNWNAGHGVEGVTKLLGGVGIIFAALYLWNPGGNWR